MGTTSPVKQESKPAEPVVDFYQALEALSLGAKIYKLEWNDKGYYGVLDNGVVKLHKPDGKLYDWTLSDGDLNGEDWTIIG